MLRNRGRQVAKARQDRINELEEQLQECEARVLSLTPLVVGTNAKPGAAAAAAAKPGAAAASGSITELNDLIGTQFGVNYDPRQHEDGLDMDAQNDLFPCGAITLECLHADATNLDCFIHSFLIATCPNFRAAKISDPKAGYLQFATYYRREICTKIADSVYANPAFTPLGGKSIVYTVDSLKRELLTPGVPLPDDLVKCLCFYYNINIIIIGPAETSVGRFARLIQGHESLQGYQPAYVISNKHGGHFEPCRIRTEHRYQLRPNETECIVTTYNSSRSNPMNIAREAIPIDVRPAYTAPKPGEWECDQCTFHNPDSVSVCQVCGAAKAAVPLETVALEADPKPVLASFNKDMDKYKIALIEWFKRNPDKLPLRKGKKGGRRTVRAHRKNRRTRFRRISSYSRRH